MTAVRLLKPTAIAMTPSYALHLAEWARRARHRPRRARASRGCSSPASPAAASRRCARSSKRSGAPRSPRRWASATSPSRSGASARTRHGMHFSGRGFVHFELIDPETGDAGPARRRRRGRARLHPSRPPGRAASPLPQPRPRRALDRPLRLRPHGAARPLHRPHRRHADRARRQRLPDRRSARSSASSHRRSAASSRSARGSRASARTRR